MNEPVHRHVEERYLAGAVREWAVVRAEPNYRDRDRAELARALLRLGMDEREIADVLGVSWLQIDRVSTHGQT